MIIGIIIACVVGYLLDNILAGLGAFFLTVLLEIFIIDHFDDLFV